MSLRKLYKFTVAWDLSRKLAQRNILETHALPIYEGTTAIQANDLVFRKTLRDGGAAVKELFDEIETEMQKLAAYDMVSPMLAHVPPSDSPQGHFPHFGSGK